MREMYIAISPSNYVLKDIYIKRSERYFKFTIEKRKNKRKVPRKSAGK